MRWCIAAGVAALVVALTRGGGARADEPRPAGKDPVVVATWEHRVTAPDKTVSVSTIKLYSNGHINDPKGKNTWTRKGDTLTLHWPSPKAPGGA